MLLLLTVLSVTIAAATCGAWWPKYNESPFLWLRSVGRDDSEVEQMAIVAFLLFKAEALCASPPPGKQLENDLVALV